MPRPANLPKLKTVGERVRWWRVFRGISRKEFAAEIGSSATALSDLENGRTKVGKKLHLIAARLAISPQYLETDEGDPEGSIPLIEVDDPWPFPAISKSRLQKLNKVERGYAEIRLLEALADIEDARKKTG